MASNASVIADEDGDFSDWIELYNYGPDPVNLMGFGLSDSYSNPYKWIFPDTTIYPGTFFLIWASGKNRAVPGMPLHTNYSISAAGEELLLTSTEQILIDELQPTSIPVDISFGRWPDASSSWYFFIEATPGLSNITQGFNEVLTPPVLSHQGGFYTEPFNLQIAHPDDGVTIVYTLDGSDPDTANLMSVTYQYKNSYPQLPGQPFGEFLSRSYKTHIYEGSLSINDRTPESESLSQISSTWHFSPTYFPTQQQLKGTVVRARAYKPGAIASKGITHSYFILNDGVNSFSLPVISLAITEANIFGYDDGLYVAGIDFDTWRLNNPDIPATGNTPANYRKEGDAYEYKAHIELFPIGQSHAALEQDMGVRMHGAFSLHFPVKSLRFYARGAYGNNYFDYPFFPNNESSQFRRIILRNSGSDYNQTLFRDAMMHRIIRHLNFDTQDYQPCILFINGNYWGIHNIRERYDKHYLARTYGVDPENIDLLELNSKVVEGDNSHYNAMLNYIGLNPLSDLANYEYIKTQMDISNFTDYQIAQIFGRNTDWPGANIKYWRLKTSEYIPEAPAGHDGRWRWLLFDTDHVFGHIGQMNAPLHNTLAFATEPNGQSWPNPSWSTFLLRNLLTNDSFKRDFISRFADLLNTAFKPERITAIIHEMKQNIESEVPRHISRWNSPPNLPSWNYQVEVMINFANQRPFYQRQHIREYFNIESDIDVTLDVNDVEAGYIRINTITVTPDTPGVPEEPYPWTGIYFHNIPIEVEAIANNGYIFSHWTGGMTSSESTLNINPSDNISLTAHFIEYQTPETEIIHYWHFNNLPSGTLTSVYSDYSSNITGLITYPGTGAGYMDRRTYNPPDDPVSNLNLLMGQLPNQGAVLRVRNPSDTRELVISAPSNGFENIVVNFATARTSNGAQGQEFYYSTDGGQNWVLHTSYPVVQLTAWELKTFDLSQIPEVNNNPDLQLKILFTGSNASGSAGNNRFDNFSVHGTPTSMPLVWYSKPTGPLYALTSWGSEPDGSGSIPVSFSNDNSSWHIRNRAQAILDGDWTVSGINSKVIAGDGVNPLYLELNGHLNATIDVSNASTLVMANALQPALGVLDQGSTVVFTGNATTVPYRTYHHLMLDGINPEFNGNGTITVSGNLTLQEEVIMPDARGAAQYSFMFSGAEDQLISTNGHVLRGYNMNFVKTEGSVGFTPESIISSDNQLTFHFTDGSTFTDNGITIYAGNSVNIGGVSDAYNFTGTLILAGTETGIVNGAGPGNNFNLRDADGSNQNPVAAINNLVVRVQNTGGEFRFRDGSTSTFIIKGDLIVESGAAGRIRFYNNDVVIGGNITIAEGFSGTVDPLQSIKFNGVQQQQAWLSLPLNTQHMVIDNTAGILMDAETNISAGLVFESGKIHLEDGSIVRMGLNVSIIGNDDSRYVSGHLGFAVNNEESLEIVFPVGTQTDYVPFGFEVSHANNDEIVYVGRVKDFEPVLSGKDASLDYIIETYAYELHVEGTPDIVESRIIIPFEESLLGFEPGLLRIAKLENGEWINIGGIIDEENISSTESFTLPGIFALAKAAIEPTVPEYLLLQNINLPGTTNTCFAATASITLAGQGSSFIVQDGASVRLVAGSSINMLYGSTIAEGAWLWAYIDDTGNFCGQPESILSVKKDDAAIYEPTSIVLKHGNKISRVYPNPTSGMLTLELLSENTSGEVIIEIFNLLGERLMLHRISRVNQFLIDLANFPAGMYLIRLNDHRNIQLERVVKR